MTLTQNVSNILETGSLSVPEIWAGLAPEGTDTKGGLLSFFPLPSGTINFADGRSNSQYQIDIWHKDIYTSEEFKDEVIDLFNGLAGIIDGKAMIFTVTDLGGIPESNGLVWHQILNLTVGYNRR